MNEGSEGSKHEWFGVELVGPGRNPTDDAAQLKIWASELTPEFDPWVEIHGDSYVLRSHCFDQCHTDADVQSIAEWLLPLVSGLMYATGIARVMRNGGTVHHIPGRGVLITKYMSARLGGGKQHKLPNGQSQVQYLFDRLKQEPHSYLSKAVRFVSVEEWASLRGAGEALSQIAFKQTDGESTDVQCLKIPGYSDDQVKGIMDTLNHSVHQGKRADPFRGNLDKTRFDLKKIILSLLGREELLPKAGNEA